MSKGGAEWTARPMTRADVPAILELISKAYGGANVTSSEAYWRWKHQDNPFGESPGLVAESADGKLVGVRVFMRWTWESAGHQIRAVRAVDTATHPDWRGQKIFSRLTEALAQQMKAEGVSFIFNTPNDKSRPGYLKMGWQDVTRVPVWVRPLRPWKLLRRKLSGTAAAAPDLSALATVRHSLEEHTGLLEDLEAANRERRLHTRHDLSQLRWRYEQCPTIDYRALAARDALVICRPRTRKGLAELTITEFFVRRSLAGIASGRSILAQLRKRSDVDWMTAVARQGTPEAAALTAFGFLPVAFLGPHLTSRPLNPTQPSPLTWKSWRPSLGDLELF